MDYRNFEVQDFLSDETFIQWVTDPTPERNKFWEEWKAQNPDRREIIGKARTAIESIDFSEKWSVAERREMWAYISSGIVLETPGNTTGMRRFAKWSYAAAATITVLIGVWWYGYHNGHIVSTDYGQIRNITLSDGTRVTLNANSQLTYSRSFLEDPVREVWIRGEAFFEVAGRNVAGERVPFIVHANQLDVEVLGTAFNVANRRGRVDVALEHGSVKVVDQKDSDNAIMLKPGEKATQIARKAPIMRQKVDIAEYTGWTEKVIRYKSKPLRELAQMIEDQYNIEIIIENDDLGNEVFTGTFPSDSVGVFFDKLGKLYPVEITRKGKTYYLK